MKKRSILAAVLWAVSLTAVMGFTSFADHGQAEPKLDEGLELIRMEGTVVSVEGGRLIINRRLGEGMEELVITLSDDTKILDGVNGYPIPGENLEKGETVQVYVGQAMTMSLPPIVNGAMVIADIPADAGFPSFTTVKDLKKNQNGKYSLSTSDGNSCVLDSDAELLPYLTRNIVTVEDLTPGRKILIWTRSQEKDTVAEKVIMFPEEIMNEEAPRTLSGWQETAEGWYFYEDGEMK